VYDYNRINRRPFSSYDGEPLKEKDDGAALAVAIGLGVVVGVVVGIGIGASIAAGARKTEGNTVEMLITERTYSVPIDVSVLESIADPITPSTTTSTIAG